MILVGLNDIQLSLALSLSLFSLGTSNCLLLFILTFPHLEAEAYLKFMGKTLQETMNIAFYTTVSILESDWLSSLPRLLIFSPKAMGLFFHSACLIFVLSVYVLEVGIISRFLQVKSVVK